MKLATAGNLVAVRALGLFDTQGNVGVQLAEQTVSDVAGGDILTFLSGKRRVVYDKVHGDRRLGDLLERNRLRVFRCADRISDVDISDTGDRNDRTDLCLGHFYFI